MRLGHAEVEHLVDHRPAVQVVPVDEGDRDAGVAGAGGAPDAVQVGLLVLGALVVDDVGDVLDVDAAGRHVGGHEDVDLAVSERAQGLLARALAEVAVDGGGREAPLREVVGDLGGGALGAAEDDRQPTLPGLQHAGEHLDLVHRVRAVDELLDGLDRVRVLLVVTHGPDVGGLAHVAAGQGDDRTGHRRREEHGLAGGGGQREEALDIREEAEVEHLVGLVEHDDAGVAEVEVALLGEVDEAPRGADDDLDAALQRLDLGLVGAPTVDGEHADAALPARPLEVAGDLHGELAGGRHGQGLRLAGERHRGEGLVARRDDPVQDRDAEAERLAGAGLGLPDDVVPGQRDREGHRLDRERAGDVVLGERLDDVRVDREVGEGCGGGRFDDGLGQVCGGVGDVGHGSLPVGLRGCASAGAAGRSEVFGGWAAPADRAHTTSAS